MAWNPEQYSRFSDERLAPARDLLRSVPARPMTSIADLGCGAGSALPLIRARWPKARIMAMDRSAEMLAVAREEGSADDYVLSPFETWDPPGKLDLIFSNAMFHWLHDQQNALVKCFSFLNPGGVLAIQIPNNWDQPSHQALFALIREVRWQDALREQPHQPEKYSLQDYYGWCRAHSNTVRVWETRYQHRFKDVDQIVGWMKGTSLGQTLSCLRAEDQPRFLNEYSGLIEKHYPPSKEGQICFPFKRIFLTATKS